MRKNPKIILAGLILLFLVTASAIYAQRAICDEHYGSGTACKGPCECEGVEGGDDVYECSFWCKDEYGNIETCFPPECSPEEI